MKKLIFFILLISTGFILSAQNNDTKKDNKDGVLPFSFGPKIGVNVSRLSTKVSDESISNLKNADVLGAHIGLFARIHYHKMYFQPELMLFFKGGKSSYDISNLDPSGTIRISQKINITSLDMPLLIGYTFGRNKINFRLFVGPAIAYTLSEKVKVTTTGIDLPEENKFNIKDATWSITGGIGFDIWLITIDARYERGLNDISWNNSFRQNPSSFIFSIGWKTF